MVFFNRLLTEVDRGVSEKNGDLMEFDSRLRRITESQPYPLVFATVSGAHLYGFASADSDWDLRGVHVLPIEEVAGLDERRETIEDSPEVTSDGFELDLVTHDVEKFLRLMLKRNGYVLEQVFSPLVVATTPEHEELKALGRDCITRHHAHHYLGFAKTQWGLFQKETPRRIKPLLYVYRVLLTGTHLMRTGRIEANINTLNEETKLPYIADLVDRKVNGREKERLEDDQLDFHSSEYERLVRLLEVERDRSGLPDQPSARAALNDLLLRLRLDALGER